MTVLRKKSTPRRDVEQQRVARPSGSSPTAASARTSDGRTNSPCFLVERGEQARNQRAIGMPLEIAVGHFAQPIVRRGQRLAHLSAARGSLNPVSRTRLRKRTKPSLCSLDRLQQRRHGLRGRRAANAARAAFDARGVVEIAELIDGGADLGGGRRRGPALLCGERSARQRRPGDARRGEAHRASSDDSQTRPRGARRRLRVLLRGAGAGVPSSFRVSCRYAFSIPRERHGVLPCIARGAVVLPACAHRRQQAFEAEVAERVGADVLANLFERMRRGDELAAARRVDAVETRRHRRRTADAQMHFLRAGRAHHLHDLAAGRPAHDRIVDQHDALPGEDALDRVELHLDAEVANRLRRLDERAADVVIADQAEAQRQLRLFRIADRGAHARVGNRHDDVGGDAGLARQQPPEVGAHLVDALPEHLAVGPREVDVLEDAVRRACAGGNARDRPQPVGADDEHLAGLDIAHVGAR